MRKIVLFFILFLLPLVSACGTHEEEITSNGITSFGLSGGLFGMIIPTLIIIVLGLMIALLIKNLNRK